MDLCVWQISFTGNQMYKLPIQACDIGANALQPRQQLLNSESAKGVSAFENVCVQGHCVALEAREK